MNFLYILLSLKISYADCPKFNVSTRGNLPSSLDEISGIIEGTNHLWVHNDSGDDPNIYGVSTNGTLLSTLTLPGITAEDWEDIAIHRKPEHSVIYIGDFGDNDEEREKTQIYFFTEPATKQSKGIKVNSFTIDYGTIGPQDAEALAIDPQTGGLYILTKGRSGKSYLMHKPAPHLAGEHYSMNIQHQFDIRILLAKNPFYITAMDIDPTGRFLVYRNYFQGFLIERNGHETWGQALQNPKRHCSVPVPLQQQGESIGFSSNGKVIWTVSEGEQVPLYAIDILDSPKP